MSAMPVQCQLRTREGHVLRLHRRAAAAAVVACVGLTGPVPLVAQETGAVSLRIAPTIAAREDAEAVLPIEIAASGVVPQDGFVSLRGLPPAVSLLDGHAVGPGWWAVPLSALPSLRAQVPAGQSGQSEIIVSLVAVDGRLLAQARSRLVIQPAPQPASASAPPSGAASPPAQAALPDEQRARAERLLARGEAYLANGNLMGARDFFERAAEAGLAASALRLATTYDPVALKQLKVQGVAPDPDLARKWYERARDLGSPEAEGPLVRLGKK